MDNHFAWLLVVFTGAVRGTGGSEHGGHGTSSEAIVVARLRQDLIRKVFARLLTR
ncbi:hypothetical protein L3i22_061070 [Actinoplanes sp. L3-i22]|nr:hypothetical protein L3i22_061070 [Actinoplanes sp. L3-i22]